MKTFYSSSASFLLSLLVGAPLAWAQSPKGLDAKKHKDTVLNKSNLNAVTVNGRKTAPSLLVTSPFTSIQASLSNSLALAPKKQARVDNSIEVISSKETGLPIFISSSPHFSSARTDGPVDKVASSFAYLKSISAITKLEKPQEQLFVRSSFVDERGNTHVKMGQKYKGIAIEGAEVIVHLGATGSGEAFNGLYHLIKKDIDIKPSLSPAEAAQKAIAHLSSHIKFRELTKTEKTLLEYTGPKVDTVIYQDKSIVRSYVLAYQIKIRPDLLSEWLYVVDAKSGAVLDFYKNSCHADGPRTATRTDLNGVPRTVNTYQEGTTYFMIDATKSMYVPASSTGLIQTLDANNTGNDNFKYQDISSTTNTWSALAVSAHYNAGLAFDYYKKIHNRNSIDNLGGTIYSFINVADDDGTGLDNAYWNGKAMFYGNGKEAFKPLAGSLDVAGHEMTHGVVQNSAGLKYQGESGAINESMADIFGCMIDSTDWLIGEDVVQATSFPSGALRSLSDPHNGGGSGYQPRTVSEQYKGTQDNGGVHINSGIPNWAFYKLATNVGRYRASLIFYKALTVYLTQSSQFRDLRLAVVKAATDVYGGASNEVTQTKKAFDEVGITDGTGGTYTTNLPTNPGAEYMLIYNTDATDNTGFYRVPIPQLLFNPLTNKFAYNKPSVSDDGKTALVIGNDHKMYELNIDPSVPFSFEIIQDEPIWSNVSLSRDGKRLAAVTLDKDTSIYVYDFELGKFARFQLYNPTFTEGIKAAGPIYADALEWDYTGEYLIYDCFNSLQGTSGQKLEYWDINFLKVWDKAKNTFGDGAIYKLFNSLEEGESIGNPSYSKNSPNIIAFDYINEGADLYGIFGLDIEKNNYDVIANNNTIGWPSFNKADNKVAYTTESTTDYNINTVTLNADKISSSATPVSYITGAKWGVYYALGNRVTTPVSLEEVALNKESIVFYPNPTSGMLNLEFASAQGTIALEIMNSLGMVVLSKKVNGPTSQVDLAPYTSGVYTVILKYNGSSTQFKVVKQ